MADTPTFAGIALRTTQQTWDTGLHGEIEGAEVDVGLAIDGESGGPQRVGLWVETERLGRLALALDVPPSGAAYLSALSHAREARGPLVALVAPATIEAEQLQQQLGEVQAALDTERAGREAVLREDAARYEDALAALRQELEEARADLGRGQEERRRGQAELDAMKAELQARPAAQQEGSAEPGRSAERVAELEQALAASETRAEEIGQHLADRAARVAELESALAEAKQAEAKVAGLEKKAAEADERKESLTRERTRLRERTAELATTREALNKATVDASAMATLAGEVEQLKLELANAQAAAAQDQSNGGSDAEVALAAEMEKSARLLQERDEAREVARDLKRAATQAIAERDEARTLARSLHQRSSTTSGGKTAEVQSITRQLNEQRAVAKNLLEDKQLLETRLLAAQRQIELERKRLARLGGATQDSVTDEMRVPTEIREATAEHKAFTPSRATEPEMPLADTLKPGKKP